MAIRASFRGKHRSRDRLRSVIDGLFLVAGSISETSTVEDLERLHNGSYGVPANSEGIGGATEDDGAEGTEEAWRYGRGCSDRV